MSCLAPIIKRNEVEQMAENNTTSEITTGYKRRQTIEKLVKQSKKAREERESKKQV